MDQRIKWIDNLKGIGIISVVAGHIFMGDFIKVIFLFHMPLFFFLGGYLFKTNSDYWEFFKKKSSHLLIPYSAFLVLIYVPQALLQISQNSNTSLLKVFLRPILGGQFLIEWTGVFWFITCFFLVRQILNWLICRLNHYQVSFTMIIFIVLAYVNSILFPTLWLPWNAHVILAASPIFFIGYMYKTNSYEINTLLNLFLAVIAVFLCYYIPFNSLNMKITEYGIPVLTIVSSLILILNLITLSKYLINFAFITSIISLLGSASMVIMYLHQPIHFILKDYLHMDVFFIFLSALTVPLSFWHFLRKSSWSRKLFLGET